MLKKAIVAGSAVAAFSVTVGLAAPAHAAMSPPPKDVSP